MANHKSAAKRNRQRITRTTRGKAFRTRVRSALKDANAAIEEKADGAAELVKKASSLLDKAASKNALPQKRASRLKSRLAAKLHGSTKG
jgi:small subunit ribosomal protein S20